MTHSVGQIALDFTLPDQNSHEHTLSDYRGQWVLLYFYPRDNTPGCTREACALRDSHTYFNDLDAVVLGISTDSVASHDKFAGKHSLPFNLLADENKAVVKSYGVYKPKKMMGKEFLGTLRSSFLIDPEGRISKIYENVKPAEHAQQVLEDLKELVAK